MKSFTTTIRSLHRDLGYFVIGLTLIYAITGIILSGRALGWLEVKYKLETTIEKNLNKKTFKEAFKNHLQTNTFENIPKSVIEGTVRTLNRTRLEDGKGKSLISKFKHNSLTYYQSTGEVTYVTHTYPAIIQKLNMAHKSDHRKTWFYLSIAYSLILSFLAISSFWMLKGKNGFKKRGVYLMIAGIITVIVFLLLG